MLEDVNKDANMTIDQLVEKVQASGQASEQVSESKKEEKEASEQETKTGLTSEQKIKLLEKVHRKCGNVRNLIICTDDEVSIAVGRYWFTGRVIDVSKMGIVLLNDMQETAIAIGKISFIVITKRGKWYRKYLELASSEEE